MAGLSAAGLEIKTIDDVLADSRSLAADIFADLVPAGDTVDTGPNSSLGRMIGVMAPSEALLWEAIQQVYDSFNPNTAIGVSLDNIVALSGINRRPARPTRAQVILEGTINTNISSPRGKVSSSTTQHVFSLVSPVILSPMGASGIGIDVVNAQDSTVYTVSYASSGTTIDVSITSGVGATKATILAAIKAQADIILEGAFTSYYKDDKLFISRADPFQIVNFSVTPNLAIRKVIKLAVVEDDVISQTVQVAGSIDTISVPIQGWDSVTNPVSATTGRLTETDVELRERFRNSKFVQSANIIESLIDALINVEGVVDVRVYENDTMETNSLGVPPKSFMPIVLGGLPTDVGTAIWENKPTGISSEGDTTIQIVDSTGLPHPISYKIPDMIPVFVTVNISNTGSLPGDGLATIRQNIVDYGRQNYLIGDEVIYSRLYIPVNQVPGHMVNSLTIGTTADPTGMTNIPIGFDQVATFAPENIKVVLTP